MNKSLTVVLIVLVLGIASYALLFGNVFSLTKDYKINKITRDYFTTHSYSKADLFSCIDMSTDLWNQFKTAGFNSKIAIGNLEKQNATTEEVNHAWVLVESSPFKWLAIETTQGVVIGKNGNAAYFNNGVSFDDPSELQKYLELRILYFEQLNKIEAMQITTVCNEYRNKITSYNSLAEAYNQLYANQRVSTASQTNFTTLRTLKEDIKLLQGRCETENQGYANELKILNDLNEKMSLLLI